MTDIQLLGQITPAGEWPKVLAHSEKRNPGGVGAWPRRLDGGSYALNLCPVPPTAIARPIGIGGDPRKRQPKRLLCTPGLTTFSPGPETGDAHTALAVVCATWLDDIATSAFPAVRLAPPILETWAANGRLLAREIIDFGLPWTLAPAKLSDR